jgi:hypothetical protein
MVPSNFARHLGFKREMDMAEYFEACWETVGTHGAKSDGLLSSHETREEAETAALQAKAEFAGDAPGNTTGFFVVQVRADKYGNREDAWTLS